MESSEFIKSLQAAGYDADYDQAGVVTVEIDPVEKNADELREFIKAIGWERSYGIKYTSRPPEWDEEPRSGSARPPRAPNRDAMKKPKKCYKNAIASGAPARRTAKAKQAAVDDQIEGQLSFADCFGNMIGGKGK